MNFSWSVPQKRTSFDHFGARDDPTITISNIFDEKGCKDHWGHGGCCACRGSKVLKITTEDFRVIQVLEFRFILMFWKILIWYIHEISYWNLPPFLLEAVEASWCYFLENWWMKLKCPLLLKPLANLVQEKFQSFYPSEPIRISHFTMRHPVCT